MTDRRDNFVPDPYLGKLFDGRYEVTKKLGVGGMGAVYQANQLNMDRMVALKVIHKDLAEDETVVKRFNREMRTTSRIAHPNVVTVYDFGQSEDGQYFLAMELLNGEILQERLASGPLPVDHAVHIGVQVLKALSAAHEEHVIHRDLKPENIMLVEQYGETDVVRVLDFGIATFSSSANESNARVTASGIMVGTPSHVSPEQISGEDLDHRSDLYSFGVLMYQMVTGKLPFYDPERPLRVLQMHMTAAPERPSEVAAQEVPDWLDALILKLLAKYPDERPASADEVIAMLEGGRDARPPESTPAAAPVATEGRPQNLMLAVGVGLAILFASLGGILVGYLSAQPAGP